jgi:TRAP-type mannitol/chloroaromatic compound transport system permease small subunit
MRWLCGTLRRALGGTLDGLKWLVLPVSLLLFLQWPLREVVRGYSREANDLGQWMFALYVAASVTAATRAGTHLAADALARRYGRRARRTLALAGNLAALMPWAILVAYSSGAAVLRSLGQLERFPDTGNPGYFLVKLALWLLAGLMVAAIALDLCGRPAGAVPSPGEAPEDSA